MTVSTAGHKYNDVIVTDWPPKPRTQNSILSGTFYPSSRSLVEQSVLTIVCSTFNVAVHKVRVLSLWCRV